MRPQKVWLLAALSTSVLAAGCGGGSKTAAAPTPSTSSTAPSPSESPSESASPADSPTPSDSPSAAGQRPPAAGALTKPGTKLVMNETATVVYDESTKTTLQVTPKSVKQGTVADFEGYKLDATAKASTPFFVSMNFRNVGKVSLKYPYLNVKLKATDAAGDDAQKLIATGLSACKSDQTPTAFRPGDSEIECAIFLVPKGAKVTSISYQGTFTDAPITWSVTPSTA